MDYLQSWEDGKVNLLIDVVHDFGALLSDLAQALAVEDHGPPGTPQGLVGGRGHHIRVVKG